MKQAILQVIPPKQIQGSIPHETSVGLSNISRIAKEQSPHDEKIQSLGEYAWLIPIEKYLPTLCRLVVEADNANLSYRIAYLENELKWDSFNSYAESK